MVLCHSLERWCIIVSLELNCSHSPRLKKNRVKGGLKVEGEEMKIITHLEAVTSAPIDASVRAT